MDAIYITIIVVLAIGLAIYMNENRIQSKLIETYKKKDENNKYITVELQKLRDSNFKTVSDLRKELRDMECIYFESIGFKKDGYGYSNNTHSITFRDNQVIIRGKDIGNGEEGFSDIREFHMMLVDTMNSPLKQGNNEKS